MLFLVSPFSSIRSFIVTPLNLREMSHRLSPDRTVYMTYPSDTVVAGLLPDDEELRDGWEAAGPLPLR